MMNIALWLLQALLALFFVAAGLVKVILPIDSLASRMPWIRSVPVALVRFIGAAEILGGVGLTLPVLTGVQAWLTPLAAVGLTLVMLFPAIYHLSRREVPSIGVNVALGVVAAFVAYGRGLLVPA